MTNILNSIKKIIVPIVVGTMIMGGMLALVGPASAADITEAELLPKTFSSETGLGDKDLKTGIGSLIKSALGFLGIIAVVIILYGGFVWMTAQGDETKLKKAQGIIVSGAIGLAIILSAYMITTFVIGELLGVTTTTTAVPAG